MCSKAHIFLIANPDNPLIKQIKVQTMGVPLACMLPLHFSMLLGSVRQLTDPTPADAEIHRASVSHDEAFSVVVGFRYYPSRALVS